MLIAIFLISNSFATYERNYETCISERIDRDKYEVWKNTTSFYDVSAHLVSDIVVSNFTIQKEFIVKDFERRIDIPIYFKPDTRSDNVWGTYYSPPNSYINIYVGEIYNYSTSRGYNYGQFIDNVRDTLIHEIAHYFDIEREGYQDIQGTFGFDQISNRFQLSTSDTNYFISLFNDTLLSPQVEEHRRFSVDFAGVFDRYDSDDHYDEVVARVTEICLREVSNGIMSFQIGSNYAFCDNNFNFNNQDAQGFNVVVDDIMAQYYFDAFPEERKQSNIIDGVCRDFRPSTFLEDLGNGLGNFLNATREPLAYFLFGLAGVLFAIGIVRTIQMRVAKK